MGGSDGTSTCTDRGAGDRTGADHGGDETLNRDKLLDAYAEAEKAGVPDRAPQALIGVVGTNQERKNWGFTAELCRAIRRVAPGVRFWWHCDTPLRHVNIDALLDDFDLTQDVTVTYPPVSDQWMAEMYRRCTLTLLPSLGEGHGYPIFESFACDTPCLHTMYAGGASVMQTCGLSEYLVPPSGEWRIEGQYNNVRPVLSIEPWMNAVIRTLNEKRDPGQLASHVEHLRWGNIAGRWLKWFRDGIS